MRAVMLHEAGDPGALRTAEVPRPVPGEGELLVEVEAMAVAYYEIGVRTGVFPMPGGLPAVFGFEAAGRITEGPRSGQRVVVLTRTGGAYAEYLAVPEEAVTPIPDGVSAVDALAVAVPGAVALALLRKAALRDERILVQAAGSGGVGSYLIQLARARGARHITATVGGERKRRLAEDLGADLVLDHNDPQWTERVPRGLGVVFDAVGGRTAAKLLDALEPGPGRMLCYGMLGGEPAAVGVADLGYRELTLATCMGASWFPQVSAARPEVLDLLARGRLRALVHETMPMEEVAKAHELVEGRSALGRIILRP
ncbi:zinc-binding dehydrogenase [Amycolatopsis cynarae]|uniref:Zinc-binding dehydrogenase n=1 Tax=Amycolatopsis cynarae TaxID=2995223 RepID=A0ABY7B083_9PSEU|nr:zinc-binding dehydrogenase [Amycolatopsis sp. HUAS 11-8]WAL65704.1 zinc-binding dehydrogenase [Amycolatopsis sp. HUAS 11-8]